jgi:hypothetical protein
MVRSGNRVFHVSKSFTNRLFIGRVFGIIGIGWRREDSLVEKQDDQARLRN